MSGRETVLGAVRAALGSRTPDARQIEAEAAALLQDPEAIRPSLPARPVEAFVARVTSVKLVGTSLDRIPAVAAFPAAVAGYLAGQGLPPAATLQPSPILQQMDWSGFDLHPTIALDEMVGIGIARWGIAETGSIVFHSGGDTPILSNFLPLHHVVLLREADVLAHLEDYAAAAAATGEGQPRNVNIVTGASGTTDIEGILVRGAHGPRSLHIVLAAG